MYVCGDVSLASSQLLVCWGELTNRKELTLAGTLFATSLTRLLVLICVKVVVMHVLRVILTLASVRVQIVATIGEEVPARLGLVSEKDVGTIMPPQEAHNSLRELP